MNLVKRDLPDPEADDEIWYEFYQSPFRTNFYSVQHLDKFVPELKIYN
jgi:hypothetical protein